MAKCMNCGEPILGVVMTNFDDFCTHEECFETEMNNRYGKGNWRCTDDDGADGFYEYYDENDDTWYGTGIFCTQLEGEDDDLLDAITWDQDNIIDFDPAE